MKREIGYLALLIFAFAAPPANAQAEPVPVLTDPVGDVGIFVLGGRIPLQVDSLDLVSLIITETADEFEFELATSSLSSGPAGALTDSNVYHVIFRINDQPYTAILGIAPGVPAYGWLETGGGANSSYAGPLDVLATDRTIQFPVSRFSLVDSKNVPPFPGQTITDVKATARSQVITQGQNAYQGDSMPDRGTMNYTVLMGTKQDGLARLSSPEPFRSSNGLASVFPYVVEAQNLGPSTTTYELGLLDVPVGWSVVLPDTTITIPGQSATFLTLFAKVTGVHQHGRTAAFTLTMDDGNGNVGRAQLGVRYLVVAQPSGHHPTLYFHSHAEGDPLLEAKEVAGQTENLFSLSMNTLAELDTDHGVGVPGQAQANNGIPMGQAYNWLVNLAPQVQMGLDLDLDRVGRLDLNLLSQIGYQSAKIEATLTACIPGEEQYTCLRIAEGFAEEINVGPQAATVSVPMTPLPEGDLIPYVKGTLMSLAIQLSGDRIAAASGPEAVYLLPESSLSMPWVDFIESVAPIPSKSGLALDVVAGTSGSPGQRIGLPVRIQNHADHDLRVNVSAIVPDGTIATLDSDGLLSVASRGEATATLVIDIPPEAPLGSKLNLLVQAFDQSNPKDRSVVQVVITVEQVGDAPIFVEDQGTKDSPQLGMLALGALLVLAAARRR